MWQIWLIISGFFLISEIITVGFLLFWFSIGALFAMIISFFVSNIVIQTAVFVVSSTLLIFLTRPFFDKITANDEKQITNAYSIIGKHGIVITEINSVSGVGQVKIGSEIWSAKCEEGSNKKIPVGTDVEIIRIDGVKAIVKF